MNCKLKPIVICLVLTVMLTLSASQTPARALTWAEWNAYWAQLRLTQNQPQPSPAPAPVPAPTPVPTPTPVPVPAPAQVPVATPSPNPPAGSGQFTFNSDETKMLELVNKERVSRGMKPFQSNPLLAELARKKSQDMVDKNYFGHTSPTYGSAYDMMRAAGIKFRYAAENLARNSNVTYAHMMLMDSSAHRNKILGANYSQIGIGVVKTSRGGVMVTQMFVGY